MEKRLVNRILPPNAEAALKLLALGLTTDNGSSTLSAFAKHAQFDRHVVGIIGEFFLSSYAVAPRGSWENFTDVALDAEKQISAVVTEHLHPPGNFRSRTFVFCKKEVVIKPNPGLVTSRRVHQSMVYTCVARPQSCVEVGVGYTSLKCAGLANPRATAMDHKSGLLHILADGGVHTLDASGKIDFVQEIWNCLDIAIDSEAGELFAVHPRCIEVYDVQTRGHLRTLVTGHNPGLCPVSIALHPSRPLMLVSVDGCEGLWVFNRLSGRRLRTYDNGLFHMRNKNLFVDPDTTAVYVARSGMIVLEASFNTTESFRICQPGELSVPLSQPVTTIDGQPVFFSCYQAFGDYYQPSVQQLSSPRCYRVRQVRDSTTGLFSAFFDFCWRTSVRACTVADFANATSVLGASYRNATFNRKWWCTLKNETQASWFFVHPTLVNTANYWLRGCTARERLSACEGDVESCLYTCSLTTSTCQYLYRCAFSPSLYVSTNLAPSGSYQLQLCSSAESDANCYTSGVLPRACRRETSALSWVSGPSFRFTTWMCNTRPCTAAEQLRLCGHYTHRCNMECVPGQPCRQVDNCLQPRSEGPAYRCDDQSFASSCAPLLAADDSQCRVICGQEPTSNSTDCVAETMCAGTDWNRQSLVSAGTCSRSDWSTLCGLRYPSLSFDTADPLNDQLGAMCQTFRIVRGNVTYLQKQLYPVASSQVNREGCLHSATCSLSQMKSNCLLSPFVVPLYNTRCLVTCAYLNDDSASCSSHGALISCTDQDATGVSLSLYRDWFSTQPVRLCNDTEWQGVSCARYRSQCRVRCRFENFTGDCVTEFKCDATPVGTWWTSRGANYQACTLTEMRTTCAATLADCRKYCVGLSCELQARCPWSNTFTNSSSWFNPRPAVCDAGQSHALCDFQNIVGGATTLWDPDVNHTHHVCAQSRCAYSSLLGYYNCSYDPESCVVQACGPAEQLLLCGYYTLQCQMWCATSAKGSTCQLVGTCGTDVFLKPVRQCTQQERLTRSCATRKEDCAIECDDQALSVNCHVTNRCFFAPTSFVATQRYSLYRPALFTDDCVQACGDGWAVDPLRNSCYYTSCEAIVGVSLFSRCTVDTNTCACPFAFAAGGKRCAVASKIYPCISAAEVAAGALSLPAPSVYSPPNVVLAATSWCGINALSCLLNITGPYYKPNFVTSVVAGADTCVCNSQGIPWGNLPCGGFKAPCNSTEWLACGPLVRDCYRSARAIPASRSPNDTDERVVCSCRTEGVVSTGLWDAQRNVPWTTAFCAANLTNLDNCTAAERLATCGPGALQCFKPRGSNTPLVTTCKCFANATVDVRNGFGDVFCYARSITRACNDTEWSLLLQRSASCDFGRSYCRVQCTGFFNCTLDEATCYPAQPTTRCCDPYLAHRKCGIGASLPSEYESHALVPQALRNLTLCRCVVSGSYRPTINKWVSTNEATAVCRCGAVLSDKSVDYGRVCTPAYSGRRTCTQFENTCACSAQIFTPTIQQRALGPRNYTANPWVLQADRCAAYASSSEFVPDSCAVGRYLSACTATEFAAWCPLPEHTGCLASCTSSGERNTKNCVRFGECHLRMNYTTDQDTCMRLCGNRYAVACVVSVVQTPTLGQQVSLSGRCTLNCPLGLSGSNCSIAVNPVVDCDTESRRLVCGNDTQVARCQKQNFTAAFNCTCQPGWTSPASVYVAVKARVLPSAKNFFGEYVDGGDGTLVVRVNSTAQRCEGFIRYTRNDSETALYCGAFAVACSIACVNDVERCRRVNYTCSGRARAWGGLPCARDYDEVAVFRNNGSFTGLLLDECGNYSAKAVVRLYYNDSLAVVNRTVVAGSCECLPGYYGSRSFYCDRSYYTRACNDAEVALIDPSFVLQCTVPYQCQVQCYPPGPDPVTRVPRAEVCYSRPEHPCLDNWFSTVKVGGVTAQGACGAFADSVAYERCRFTRDVAMRVQCEGSFVCACATGYQSFPGPRGLPCERDYAVLPIVTRTELSYFCGLKAVNGTKRCRFSSSSVPLCYQAHLCQCQPGYGQGFEVSPLDTDYDTPHDGVTYYTRCGLQAVATSENITRECGPFAAEGIRFCDSRGLNCKVDCSCQPDSGALDARPCSGFDRNCTFAELSDWCTSTTQPLRCRARCDVNGFNCVLINGTCEYKPALVAFGTTPSTLRDCTSSEVAFYCGRGGASCKMTVPGGLLAAGSCVCDTVTGVVDASLKFGVLCPPFQDLFFQCSTYERQTCGFIGVHGCRLRHAFVVAAFDKSSSFWVDQLVVRGTPGVYNRSSPVVGTASAYFVECLCTPYPNQQTQLYAGVFWKTEASHSADRVSYQRLRYQPWSIFSGQPIAGSAVDPSYACEVLGQCGSFYDFGGDLVPWSIQCHDAVEVFDSWQLQGKCPLSSTGIPCNGRGHCRQHTRAPVSGVRCVDGLGCFPTQTGFAEPGADCVIQALQDRSVGKPITDVDKWLTLSLRNSYLRKIDPWGGLSAPADRCNCDVSQSPLLVLDPTHTNPASVATVPALGSFLPQAVLPPVLQARNSRISADSSFAALHSNIERIAWAPTRAYYIAGVPADSPSIFTASQFRSGWYIQRQQYLQSTLSLETLGFNGVFDAGSLQRLCRNDIYWFNVIVYSGSATPLDANFDPQAYLENCAALFSLDNLAFPNAACASVNLAVDKCSSTASPYLGVPFFARVPSLLVFHQGGGGLAAEMRSPPTAPRAIPGVVLDSSVEHYALEQLDPYNYNYLFYDVPCRPNKCSCDANFDGTDCNLRALSAQLERGAIFYSITMGGTNIPDYTCQAVDPNSNCCPGKPCVFPIGYDADAQCVNGQYNWATGLCDCIPAFDRDLGTGWCTVSRCPPNRISPCNGHGHCVARGVCVCDAGYTGEACEIATFRICPPFSFAAPMDPNLVNQVTCSGVGLCVEKSRVSAQTIFERSMNGSGATADQVQMACQCFTSRDGHGGFRGTSCNESYYDLRSTCESNGGTVEFVRLVPLCPDRACTFDMSNYTAGQYDIKCRCPDTKTGALCERWKCPVVNGQVCNGVGVCARDPITGLYGCRQPLADRWRVAGFGACLDSGSSSLSRCQSLYLNALAQTPAPLVCGSDGSSRFGGAACDVDLKTYCSAPGQDVLCGETRGVAYEMAACEERLNVSNGVVYYACRCTGETAGTYCEKSICDVVVPASERAKWTRGTCNGQQCVYQNGDAYCRCKDAPDVLAGERLYVGRYCQYDVTVQCGFPDPLTPNIYSECFNQGICVAATSTTFACQCNDGVAGQFCEATNCEAPCGRYGTCTRLSPSLYGCVCNEPLVWALNSDDHNRCTKNGCRRESVYPDDPIAARPNEDGTECVCEDQQMSFSKLCRSRSCPTSPDGFSCGRLHAADAISASCRLGDRKQCDTFYKQCNTQGECVCGKGYALNETTGLCDQRCDPTHTLSVLSTGPGANDFLCQCDAQRYQSRFCESDFCLNGGQPVGGRLGECVCVLPFAGARCELVDCSNHGSLNATGNGCKCDDGWTGPRCDQQFTCTATVTTVLQRGETQVCTVDNRWRNTPVFVTTTQRIPCVNATTVSCDAFQFYNETSQQCQCLPGYFLSQQKTCTPLTCLNNGVLVDNSYCRCRPDNYGDRCQYRRCGDFGALACVFGTCQCVCVANSGYSVDPLTGNCTKTACGVWGTLRLQANGQRCECRSPAVYDTTYGSPLCILRCQHGVWEPRVPSFDDGDDQHCICESGYVGVVCDTPLTQEIGDSLVVGRSFTLSNGTVRFLTSTSRSALNASAGESLSDALVTDGKAANLAQPAVRNPAVDSQSLQVAANASILLTVSGAVLPTLAAAPTSTNTGSCTSLDGCGLSSGEISSDGFAAAPTDYAVQFQSSAFVFPGPTVMAVDEKPNITQFINVTNVTTTVVLTDESSGGVAPVTAVVIAVSVVCGIGIVVLMFFLAARTQ